MIEAIEHFITHTVANYGYLAVFVLMVLESACIPIPSEVTMVFAGALTSPSLAAPGKQLDFVAVALLGTVANLFGSWIAYWVGYVGGRPLARRWGRYVLLRPDEIERAERWFDRHGEAAVFFSRLLPAVRTFISLPAGVARMPFVRFSLYTFAGCLPWVFALTAAGFALGESWERVGGVLRPVALFFGAALLAVAVWWVVSRVRAARRMERLESSVHEAPKTSPRRSKVPPPS